MEEFSYIVLDLEWNQPMPGQETITQPFRFDSEIIEIGALKLNSRFEEVSEFKSFVRPVFYPSMNGHVVQLTKIRPQELEKAPDFPAAYAAFRDWCGEDCCLCTWGPDDLPVLMDNLLMHGLDAALPDGYDLQRIFGHEIMRDDRQCSLERAMELLRLKPDRAHDALNDARNTVRVCGSMDLERCMEEYCLRYIDYGPDRLAGRVGGLPYPDLPAAQADPQLTALTCPYCGQPLTLGEWTRKDGNIPCWPMPAATRGTSIWPWCRLWVRDAGGPSGSRAHGLRNERRPVGCVPALHRAAGISGAQQGTRLSTENRRTVQLSGGFLSVFQISLGVGTHGEAFAADGNGDAEGEVCSLLCGALTQQVVEQVIPIQPRVP